LTEKNLLKGLKQIIATAIQNIDATNPKNNNKKENIKTGATTITISTKNFRYSQCTPSAPTPLDFPPCASLMACLQWTKTHKVSLSRHANIGMLSDFIMSIKFRYAY
jgi:hypothetical protein